MCTHGSQGHGVQRPTALGIALRDAEGSLLLPVARFPGHRTLARGADAAPRGHDVTAPPARAGLTPALAFTVPVSSQGSGCARAPLTHDVSVVTRV